MSAPMSTAVSEPHRGVTAILGPPTPRNPQRSVFLALKTAAACALALFFDSLTGNRDHVSSTFVAVLCVSPVVLMGLRRSLDQVAGSAIGGLCGAACMVLGLSKGVGIPLAVGAAVLAALMLGFGRGFTVAAFSAMFVQAVPFGGPLQTLGVRCLAVGTATLSAFLVNVIFSAAAYRSIFGRRLRFAEATVSALLTKAAEEGPRVVRAGFPVLAELDEELRLAQGELRLRRAPETAAWIDGLRRRVGQLQRLLHLVLDLDYRLAEEDLPVDAMQEWLRWLVREGGEEPEVPETLRATTRRIRRLGRSLIMENSHIRATLSRRC